MHLVAPQYSDGLDLYIYSYKIHGGGLNGQHLDEINNLNHYIGMKPIRAGGFPRDALDAICLRFDHPDDRCARSSSAQMSNVVDLFAVYSYFGVFSIGSFWYRLYTYGHNLDPHAPDAHQAVHTAPDRREANREFPRVQLTRSSAPILLCVSVVLIVLAGLVFAKGRLIA